MADVTASEARQIAAQKNVSVALVMSEHFTQELAEATLREIAQGYEPETTRDWTDFAPEEPSILADARDAVLDTYFDARDKVEAVVPFKSLTTTAKIVAIVATLFVGSLIWRNIRG